MKPDQFVNKNDENNYNEGNDVLLFEKGKRGVIRMLFGRTGIVILLLLIQLMLWFSIYRFLGNLMPFAFSSFFVLSAIMIIYVINKEHDATVKITWIILIALLPVFGALLYIYIQSDIGHRTMKKQVGTIFKESEEDFPEQDELMDRLRTQNRGLFNIASYTGKAGGFPIYENSSTKYFTLGEEAFLL